MPLSNRQVSGNMWPSRPDHDDRPGANKLGTADIEHAVRAGSTHQLLIFININVVVS